MSNFELKVGDVTMIMEALLTSYFEWMGADVLTLGRQGIDVITLLA